MDRNGFDKKLNYLINKNLLSISFIKDFLSTDKISFKDKLLRKSHINSYDLIRENYINIIIGFNNDSKVEFIEYLSTYKEFSNILDDNLVDVLKILNNEQIESIIKYFYSDNIKPFEDNIDLILSTLSYDKVFNIMCLIRYKSNIIDYKFERKINRYKNEFINVFTTKMNLDRFDEKESLIDIIRYLIDDLCNNECKSWLDITLIGSGSYSNIYLIGNKTIKFGRDRKTFNIPYHKRLLKPIIRIKLSKYDNKFDGVIEITEKVIANNHVSEKELLDLYKELRDSGIVYGDIKPDNIGRLEKPNLRYWKNSLGENLGIDNFDSSDALLAGDYVILDSDYLYRDTDNYEFGNQYAKYIDDKYEHKVR